MGWTRRRSPTPTDISDITMTVFSHRSSLLTKCSGGGWVIRVFSPSFMGEVALLPSLMDSAALPSSWFEVCRAPDLWPCLYASLVSVCVPGNLNAEPGVPSRLTRRQSPGCTMTFSTEKFQSVSSVSLCNSGGQSDRECPDSVTMVTGKTSVWNAAQSHAHHSCSRWFL